MPSFCSIDKQLTRLGPPRAPFGIDQDLGHHEAGDATGAGRGVRDAGQDEVDDVVGQVVLAVGDEDLLAADAPGAVTGRHRSGADGTEVGTGVGLGQVHGAGPFPTDELGQEGGLEVRTGMGEQEVDRSLGEPRAQGERQAGRGHQLGDDGRHQTWKLAAAVVGWEGQGSPPGGHVATVRLGEAWRRGDRAVVVAPAVVAVADPVERGDHLGDEPARLGEEALRRGRGRRGV